jgi:multisubunit Na+/H+ antiporter MnhE subunit
MRTMPSFSFFFSMFSILFEILYSFWRVASHRHSFAQILVGAILGSFIGYVARLGELAIFVEKNIPFLPAALMRRINNITSGEVTFLARLCTLLLGFITLYTAHVIEKLLKIANTKKSVPS